MKRLLWLGALLAVACTDPARDIQPAASASSSLPDQSAYCQAVCDRATACGIEQLEQTVKANAADVAVLNKARSAAAATTESCAKTCQAEPAGSAQAQALTDADRCIAQSSCDSFAACLATVANADN